MNGGRQKQKARPSKQAAPEAVAMEGQREVERSAIVRVTPDLRMIAFDEQSGRVITWGSAAESEAITLVLKTLGFAKVKMQA